MSALLTLGNKLPIGMMAKGQKFDTFEVGYARGSLRRQLNNVIGNNMNKIHIVALQHLLTKLGNLETPPAEFVQRLTQVDVEYIMLFLTTRDLDNKIPLNVRCASEDGGGCGFEIKDTVAPSNVEMLDGDPVEFVDDKATQVTSIFDPSTNSVVPVRFRLMTLKDGDEEYERATQTVRKNKAGVAIGDILNDQLCRYMMDYNGRGKGLSSEELDKLPLSTYDALIQAYTDLKTPRLDLEVAVTCPKCGNVVTTQLPYNEWLRPLQRKEQ